MKQNTSIPFFPACVEVKSFDKQENRKTDSQKLEELKYCNAVQKSTKKIRELVIPVDKT